MSNDACQWRKVLDDGRVICSKIVLGDREVSASLCSGCPAMACNCQHLRFSLQKHSVRPVVVRWGNGHTEIWDDELPVLSFLRSACAVRSVPISSVHACVECYSREGWAGQEEKQGPSLEVMTLVGESSMPVVRA
jgi:hypothetical protein